MEKSKQGNYVQRKDSDRTQKSIYTMITAALFDSVSKHFFLIKPLIK